MRRFERSTFKDDPTEPLGVLVVGCGYWGRNYVRIFGELPDARIVAVCDGDVTRLDAVGATHPDAMLTPSLADALALPEVDLAVVCTPATTHWEIATACLRAGKHVLLEKPMATTTMQADAINAVAEETGRLLMVGHTFLFNAGVQKVREYIERGDVGRIYYIYSQRTSLGPIRHDVDALWDLAPHDIAIFNYLLGAVPTWVSAVGGRALGRERADVGFVSLGYGDDIVAHLHVSWADPHKVREVVVVGSRQRIVFNDTNPLERVRVFEKGIEADAEASPTFGEFHFLLRDGQIISPVVEASEPLKNQCQHFVECIRDGRRPTSDGLVGRGVVSVMEAVDRSLAEGGHPIPVDPAPSVTEPAAA
jgi:predicted dehydrogenase